MAIFDNSCIQYNFLRLSIQTKAFQITLENMFFLLLNWIHYLPQFDLRQPDVHFKSFVTKQNKPKNPDKKNHKHIMNYNGSTADWLFLLIGKTQYCMCGVSFAREQLWTKISISLGTPFPQWTCPPNYRVSFYHFRLLLQ